MDKTEHVLVLGDSNDPHITSVCTQIRAAGVRTLILDIWQAWSHLSLLPWANGTILKSRDTTFLTRSVWLRLKPRLIGSLSEAETFAIRERRDFLTALARLLVPTCNLINDPVRQEFAANKPFQLVLATKHGLSVPTSIISNDALTVSELLGSTSSERLIYKPLTWMASMTGEVLFTNEITNSLLKEKEAAIKVAPGIFQRLIVKRCEYRVTIIDDLCFAVRIYSQERSDTALDWRRNQLQLRYEVCSLPSGLEIKLKSLMMALGLRYGAIDLVETTRGEIVFLEINPAGNWLWLEEKLSLPISATIARALCQAVGPKHTNEAPDM